MNAILEIGWTWHPSVVIGFSIWTLLYILAIQKEKSKSTPIAQQVAFHIGTFSGLVALVSPLDELGDAYLFSAHMVQHLILMFITSPLWLIGTPGWLVDRIIPQRLIRIVKWLTGPMSAFAVFVGVMFFWHIPSVYGLAQESEAIHITEHLLFIGAALIGWWPIAGAERSLLPKPEPPARMLYLFLMTVPGTTMASLLTFSHSPMYAFYVTVPHPYGLTALQDQHLGGLIMWMPMHMFLLLAIGITFLRWFKDVELREKHSFEESLSLQTSSDKSAASNLSS